MSKKIIGIGEYAAAKNPGVIVTLGLGSCVGVCLRDKNKKIGGMIHVMLPSSGGRDVPKPGKYADTGIDLLIEDMKKLGSNASKLQAKIAGGAKMFTTSKKSKMEVGKKNAEKIKEILKGKGIRVVSEDIGGTRARSIEFDVMSGELMIKKVGGGEKVEVFKI